MATFGSDIVRAAAIELKEKAIALYANILPIYTEVSAWTLNSMDSLLPLPYDVKVQLAAYRALKIDAIKLTDWVGLILGAQPEDTLASGVLTGLYPQTGTTILYWGTVPPQGWLLLNGETIGDEGSGATNYAATDARSLFEQLWAAYPNEDLAIQDSNGDPSTRGNTAGDDFDAQKRLPLPNLPAQIDLFPGPGLGTAGCTFIIKL